MAISKSNFIPFDPSPLSLSIPSTVNTGDTCGNDIDECLSFPCQHSGTCMTQAGQFNTYECICQVGFEGDVCEEDVDECTSTPCANGGSCTDLAASFRCECPQGTNGKLWAM